MRAPISLDLHITNFNHPDTPPDRLFGLVSDIAVAAEESGFSSISVMDRLHQIAPMGPPENWMLEGNLTLAALVARYGDGCLETSMLGDPDAIAEQAQAYADIGIQGLTIVLPDVHDLETVALAGRTLSAVF